MFNKFEYVDDDLEFKPEDYNKHYQGIKEVLTELLGLIRQKIDVSLWIEKLKEKFNKDENNASARGIKRGIEKAQKIIQDMVADNLTTRQVEEYLQNEIYRIEEIIGREDN